MLTEHRADLAQALPDAFENAVPMVSTSRLCEAS
jgi:hypothetical protein